LDEPLEKFPIPVHSTSVATFSAVAFLFQSWPSDPVQNTHRWGTREGEKQPLECALLVWRLMANQTESLIHKAVMVLSKGL